MNLKQELQVITETAIESRPSFVEEDKNKWRWKMIISRLKNNAELGFSSCYLFSLTEEEEGRLMGENLNVTKKSTSCTCNFGQGFFVDWFKEEQLTTDWGEEFIIEED